MYVHVQTPTYLVELKKSYFDKTLNYPYVLEYLSFPSNTSSNNAIATTAHFLFTG